MGKNNTYDAPPQDGIAFMQSAERVVRWSAVAAILTLAFLLVGALDYADALDAEARAKDERAAAIQAEATPTLPLSFPIPYDATVTQSGYGIDEPRTRFYVRTGQSQKE